MVDARIRYLWDARRVEEEERALKEAPRALHRAQLEGARYVADVMEITHKINQEKIQRFLLSGDINEVEGIVPTNHKTYGDLAALLLKLTGQDRPATAGKAQENSIQVNVQGGGGSGNVVDVSVVAPPDEASRLLRELELEKPSGK